ncbi:MAG: hypothetical protein ACHQAX_04110 [Gammaproteobacteria bacterium]
MNSRAYISALGNMLLHGVDETPMANAFEHGEIPDNVGARLLAGIPCAIALTVHYLVYTLGTLAFAIGLANIPLRMSGSEDDTNPITSKHAYRNIVEDLLEHLGIDKNGFVSPIFVDIVFPLINMAAIAAGFALIGWAGLINFLPAVVTFGAQMVTNAITLYNVFVPMISSFPEITIMGTAIALGGLIIAGFDWINERIDVSKKRKEGEEKFVVDSKSSEVKHIAAVTPEAGNTVEQTRQSSTREIEETANHGEKIKPG